ncbi:MAG TPA: hypothetical protein PLN91_15895 [Rhodanobacteraceae bacterium]|nr:hypothetical protein [Rhodanobacteraceae bacterium]
MWLFALVVLGKTVLAASCVADGLRAVSVTSAAVSIHADDGTQTVADDGDDDAAACWHSGAGGCHCSCAHGVALPVAEIAVRTALAPAQPPRVSHADFVSSPQPSVLRPPIA